MIPFLITIGCLAGVFFVTRTFIVVSERENVVKERVGKFQGVLQPGFHFMVPLLDRAAYRQEMREQAIDVPPQMCITKDNIQVEVDGIVYIKVEDAKDASYNIADYRIAAINLAQTTMRSEIGKLNLDETFSEREKMNTSIVREIDKASEPWGIKVLRYEIKGITPSPRVIETMEKQMEAERHKRAQVTISTGNKEAKIAVSEGERIEAVNLSEGERQKRINEANGRAAEIRMTAEANAKALALVADAIRAPGGESAVKMQLAEQYLVELGRILEHADVSVVPAQIAQVKAFFEGMTKVQGAVGAAPSATPPTQRRG
ncbi:MAG: paraslipin [Deltaproteobacteria bacterium]|nr:paraslipin [Deltaproteobacteria bacterium]